MANKAQVNRQYNENRVILFIKSVDLYAYQGSAIWSWFSAMLVANSILIAASVQTLTNIADFGFLTWSLSLIGILLCFIWYILMIRSIKWQDYWIYSAREIETELFDMPRMIARGDDFRKNETVTLQLEKTNSRPDGKMDFKMGNLESQLRVKDASKYTILLFATIYAAIIIFLLKDVIFNIVATLISMSSY